MKNYLSTLFLLLFLNTVFSQDLSRRASFDAQISYPKKNSPGAIIRKINENSPLQKAGFKVGDIILKVNDQPVINQEDWSAITYAIRSEKSTFVEIKRGHKKLTKRVLLKPLKKETHENIETFYESLVNDYGLRQRVIITKPKKQGKLPAIILIQGLSCSTIEKYSGRSNNWVKLINDLVEKSNMVVLRIDKPGVGDSEGNCGKIDFKTELSGYESAIKMLKSKSYVDTNQIIVYGNSMGSAIAPFLANKYNLAGVISEGTFFKSWYEHMLEIERRILVIEGKKESEIHDLINMVYIPLYHGMLIEKKSYFHILQRNPQLKKHHRQGLYHMYGRSMEYYHQIQDFNFAKAWEELKVPVRIRWGTNDWIMSEFDNDMIVKVLERNSHDNFKLYKYPKLDHWSTIHPDYASSFTFKPGKWEDQISQQIIDWTWEILNDKK
ncbi:MAG: PDZ domain-containing protein [Flavobacteriaceae bacterium]